MTIDEAIYHLAHTDRLVVALDFDGTLAPLIDEPMRSRMTPGARSAVDTLATVADTTVALVSGRSMVDLRLIAEHGDDSPLLLAGSHGAEHWSPESSEGDRGRDDGPLDVRDGLRSEAQELVNDIPGVWIEPKAFGFGVHSRRVADELRDEVHARVDALMAERAPDWRRRSGHHIVEYAFRAEGKDAAIAWLRELTGATAVLFAGDDVTDEDALRTLTTGDVGVRVGSGETAASVRVADISELVDMLVRLAHERASARE